MTCLAHEVGQHAPRIPVSVNGAELPYDEIAREVQFHPAPTPIEAWQAAARALAVRSLLLQEAQRLKLTPEPAANDDEVRETDEEALIRQVIEREVTVPQPTEADCARYYEQNRARLRTPSIAEASHILLAAAQQDTKTFSECYCEAERYIAGLAEDPSGFAKLARQISDCPSAAQGGNLGQLSPGQTTPAFEAALDKMEPGDISKTPVETPYGLHIIHLHRRIAGRELPFDAVKSRIANYLTDRVSRTATAQFLARLAGNAEITGIDMPDTQALRVF